MCTFSLYKNPDLAIDFLYDKKATWPSAQKAKGSSTESDRTPLYGCGIPTAGADRRRVRTNRFCGIKAGDCVAHQKGETTMSSKKEFRPGSLRVMTLELMKDAKPRSAEEVVKGVHGKLYERTPMQFLRPIFRDLEEAGYRIVETDDKFTMKTSTKKGGA